MYPSLNSTNWRRWKDIPHEGVGSLCSDQPVAYKGKLFIRSGTNCVLEYTPGADRWAKLPSLSDYESFFTLATINNHLLLVGGEIDIYNTERSVDTIQMYDETTQRWLCQRYRSMPKALTSPTVFSYQGHLVVTCGYDAAKEASNMDVDILNTTRRQWIVAEPLPTKGSYQPAILNDTVYLVGEHHKTVLRAHLPTLISGAKSGMWETVASVPYFRSSPVAIDNTLLVVGGSDSSLYGQPTTDIYMFEPAKNQWTKVGHLPEALINVSCIACLGQLFVFGSHGNNHLVYSIKLSEPEAASVNTQLQATQSSADTEEPSLKGSTTSPITFEWGRCRAMLHTEVYGQPVALCGKAYLCGISRWKANGVVLEYIPTQSRWFELSPLPVSYFVIATLNDQLLVVGGQDSTGKITDTILTFDEPSRKWVQSYSAVPRAPFLPTVTSYQDHLIVAGGWNTEEKEITEVNILNTKTNQWKAVEPLPSVGGYQAVMVTDTVYLIGQTTQTVLRAHVPTLISGAKSSVWETLQNAPYYRSSPVVVGNTLLTVGGSDKPQGGKQTTSVQRYEPTTNQWVRVSDLPEPMCGCHCVNLSGVVQVLGGLQNTSVFTSNRYL